MADELSLGHRIFDKMYPAIRFTYERVMGNEWFTEIEQGLWLGGAPSHKRDYQFIRDHGISAIINIRAERADDEAFYAQHDIHHVRYEVPDIGVPDCAIIDDAVKWMKAEAAAGRTILVHCAKGRGRSATLLAAYLMDKNGIGYEDARDLMKAKRKLVKLELRHQVMIDQWRSGKW